MKTFSIYQGIVIATEDGKLLNGDYNNDDVVVRATNGYLDDAEDEYGNMLPAIESTDHTHIEHWKKGKLHCETGPAVIDLIDHREEWWVNGQMVTPSSNL